MLLDLLLKKKKKLPWPLQCSLAYVATRGIDEELLLAFEQIEAFCLFIGYSRSGHSLVAALLDAHPNIVMAHEFRAIKYVAANFGRDALYYLMLENTRIRGHSWRRGSGYTFNVPNQWQGSFEKIKVIGDKHGEYTVNQIASNPSLLDKLRKQIRVPIKFVHIIRNPFDNIAAMAMRRAEKGYPLEIETDIRRYFEDCKAVMAVKALAGASEVFDIKHEDFVENPRKNLNELCRWLGVESSVDYLEACSSIVFDSPHKRRHKLEWGSDTQKEIQENISLYPFLQGYDFHS